MYVYCDSCIACLKIAHVLRRSTTKPGLLTTNYHTYFSVGDFFCIFFLHVHDSFYNLFVSKITNWNNKSLGGGFNPFEKNMLVKLDHSPTNRGEDPHTQMLNVWPIYLQNWVVLGVNVRR